MRRPKLSTLKYYLKWAFWILLAQTVLANISAAIYAYKFTHYYSGSPQPPASNVFARTWRLFSGPKFVKDTQEQQPPFPYQAVTLHTSSQVSLDAWYSRVDSAKGCVILVHGILVNKAVLIREAVQFRQWGYNVLLIDLRGHGKSGGNSFSFGVQETEEVQKAFAFASSQGDRKIVLYGVSLGADVCIKSIEDYQLRPAGIIADMPFSSLKEHLKARARILGFPDQPFATLVTLWMGLENGYNGFGHNVGNYAAQVHCPVLIEVGELDQYVSQKEVEQIFDRLGTKQKKMVVYPYADHQSYLQVDPMQWKSEVSSFLNQVR
jgi:alpha-beta hydrolase superfamily lysophospholipase